MIAQRATALTELAERLQAAKVLAQDRLLYETRLADLRKSRERTESLVTAWRVLRDAGVIQETRLPPNADTAVRAVHALMVAFREDPTAVNAPVYANAVESLNLMLNVFEQTLRDTWRRYCDGLAPTVQDEVLEVLKRLSSFHEMVQRLQSRRAEIDRGRRSLPRSGADVAAVRSAGKIVTLEWSRLAGNDLPPAILTFLRAVMTQGATLDTLTPEVLTWLRDRQLMHVFRITVPVQR